MRAMSFQELISAYCRSFFFVAGVRLYFTIKAFSEAEGRVNQLTLVHVRLPPGFSASTTTQRPSRVHIAHYHRGEH